MSEPTTKKHNRSLLWFTIAAAIVATAIWSSIALGAVGQSRSSGSGNSTPSASYSGHGPSFAANGSSGSHGDCPNMGGSSNNSSSTTPSSQDGSSSPSL